ncbi:FAD-dependent monooxygenase [Methylobacillus flagellatus]|uniref:FAD-dependent monooxygenase n=1 Tax=Methylobacillus flagellatus TaxID=405 RepID=UPI0010F4B53E|nr:FAD-dependent monooxygenase [Methylobacillus flagellatus]
MSRSTTDTPHRIVIIGGGPVGATLALALQQQGIASTVLESRAQGAAHADQRALALSYGSRLILERLGVWDELVTQATAINTIHISQRGSFGRTLLQAKEHDQPALGYVLSYGALSAALDRAIANCDSIAMHYQAEASAILPGPNHAQVTYRQQDEDRQLQCALAVLADGGRSLGDIPGMQREIVEYGHDALVSKVQCELPHGNIAYERFTPAGPMALLPNGARDFSLVWTGKQDEVAQLLQLSDAAFLQQLHANFGDRVGQFLHVGKRLNFPLRLAHLKPVTAPHLVVIGNAAQTMHPVAGQGFNIGLRDAWALASLLGTGAEPGSEAMLERYRELRKTDSQGGMRFTDFLVKLFNNNIVGLSSLRAAGLGLLDLVPPAKAHLVEKMSFGGRG